MLSTLATEMTVLLPGHTVDLGQHALLNARGERVELRPQALELLCLLARHAGQTVDKRQLLDQVWPGLVVTDDSLVQAVGDIRRALGDDGHHIIQTVPRRGYRLIPAAPKPVLDDAEPVSADAEPAVAALPGAEPEGLTQRPAGRRRPAQGLWAGLIAVGVMVGLVGAGLWSRELSAPAAKPAGVSPDRPPIAVLDFADPATPVEDQQMARAYAEELAGELARNADLTVIAANSSLSPSMKGQPLSAAAKRLGAAYVVHGQLRREGDHLRLTVSLVEGGDGRIVWTDHQDVVASQVYAAREALVRRIAGSAYSSMRADQETGSLQRPPASMDLYAKTLRALTLKHRFTAAATAEARELLKQVIEEDPRYAPGWLYRGYVDGLDYYLGLTGPPRKAMLTQAIDWIRQSLVLEPHLSAAYAALAVLLPAAGQNTEAVTAGRQCVALAPNDAECLMFLATAMVFDGQAAQALPFVQRAIAIEPVPPAYASGQFGLVLWANGLQDQAIVEFNACLVAAPAHSTCRINRAVALAERGQLDAARADYEVWRQRIGPGISFEQWTRAYSRNATALIERRLAAVRRIEATMQP